MRTRSVGEAILGGMTITVVENDVDKVDKTVRVTKLTHRTDYDGDAVVIPDPPKKSVDLLKKLGFKISGWQGYTRDGDDGWWVGYCRSAEGTHALFTISTVTGKALVEVCVQHAYGEVLL